VGVKLPDLKRREVDRFLQHFVPDASRDGDKVTGDGRNGSFTLHLNHGGGLRPDQLSRALRYIGVERAEFDRWYEP
jgi:hypothetical protein